MSHHTGYEEIVLGADINQDTTVVFESDGFFGLSKLSVDVSVKTGSWASAVLVIQCSASGTRWTDLRKGDGTALTIAADSMVMDIEDFKMKHVRMIPTTASGGTCTIDIIVQGIRN